MSTVDAGYRAMSISDRTWKMSPQTPCPSRSKGTTPEIEEWLATLCHELRSPLATVLGALEVIQGSPDPTFRKRASEVAERQTLKAIQLVDGLFDLVASSHGKLSLRKEWVNLAEIITGAIETCSHLMTSRRHRLTVVLPAEPKILYVDRLRLEQVLTNLLTNSAKFTAPGGEIWLTATANSNEISLHVRDSGRGIPPESLPKVFEQFMQAPDTEDRANRGLGLGLALVKSLVELHGGCVTACSGGLGAGSEFIVRLPAGPPE